MNAWLVFQVIKKVLPIRALEIDSFIWYLCAFLAFILPTAFVIWHFILR